MDMHPAPQLLKVGWAQVWVLLVPAIQCTGYPKPWAGGEVGDRPFPETSSCSVGLSTPPHSVVQLPLPSQPALGPAQSQA